MCEDFVVFMLMNIFVAGAGLYYIYVVVGARPDLGGGRPGDQLKLA